ncbi:MAG: adenylate/guanylate cyclase domain-containing protein [Saprospiraceae bacterium]
MKQSSWERRYTQIQLRYLGDTVNVAARMEEAGKANRVNIPKRPDKWCKRNCSGVPRDYGDSNCGTMAMGFVWKEI